MSDTSTYLGLPEVELCCEILPEESLVLMPGPGSVYVATKTCPNGRADERGVLLDAGAVKNLRDFLSRWLRVEGHEGYTEA